MLASTSIVCGLRVECTEGSKVGVDDHSIKLPYFEESYSCA